MSFSTAIAASAAARAARTALPAGEVDVVVYHKHCPDGFGAAWAAWRALVKEGGRKDIKFAAATHGEPASAFAADMEGKNVAVFDFSFSKEICAELRKKASAFVILDHHRSAQIEHEQSDFAFFDMDRSGAPLAWEYFFPTQQVPRFMQYIEDKDIWKWQLPESKEFSAGFGLQPMTFESFDKFYTDAEHLTRTIDNGKVVLQVQEESLARCKRKSNVYELGHGVSVAVANANLWVSELGNQLASDADFALIWNYDQKDEVMGVSLRSLGFNVSKVAGLYGGGGHVRAAGMRWPGLTIASLLEDLRTKDLSSLKA